MENAFQLAPLRVRCVLRITIRTVPNRMERKTRDNFARERYIVVVVESKLRVAQPREGAEEGEKRRGGLS